MRRLQKKQPGYKKILWFLWIEISLWILGASCVPSAKEREMQMKIANEILRFHVLANSDSRADQEEKMEVKEAVIGYLEPILERVSSKAETIDCLQEELDNIQDITEKMVYPRKVTVSLDTDWFPEISYGDCTFPQGVYETLRIQIGEAEGHNWWCVLYPGLCFSDAVKPVVTEEGKELLQNTLDEECYDFLRYPRKTKIRFRWLGLEFFWQNR